MDLDGPQAHKQSLCDLAIGLIGGGESGNPQFTRSEGVWAPERSAAWACSCGHQLRAGLFGQWASTTSGRQVEPFAEHRERGGPMPGTAQRCALGR
jgi:hypothetical protein